MQEYRAKKLDPFLRRVLGSVLLDRPDDVVDYLIKLLTSLRGENKRPSSASHRQWQIDEERELEEDGVDGLDSDVGKFCYSIVCHTDNLINTSYHLTSRLRRDLHLVGGMKVAGVDSQSQNQKEDFETTLTLLWKRGANIGLDMKHVFQNVINKFEGEEEDPASGDGEQKYEVGMVVMAEHPPSEWERRYSGKVTACNADGTYEVAFDDGDRKGDV